MPIFAAFKKTPLLMLIDDDPCLKYATQNGAGWRADCLGDMGGFSKNGTTCGTAIRSRSRKGVSRTCGSPPL